MVGQDNKTLKRTKSASLITVAGLSVSLLSGPMSDDVVIQQGSVAVYVGQPGSGVDLAAMPNS
jgi:hypothetical protein